MFHNFLARNNVLGSEFILMSCGDFDGKALKKEAEYKDFFVPSYLKEWINIKKAFPLHLYKEEFKQETVINVRTTKGVVRGMPDMLEACSLELLGRHHSGIDDSVNIARCALEAIHNGHTFTHNYIDDTKYETGFDKTDTFKETLAELESQEAAKEINIEDHLLMMQEYTDNNE